MLAALYNIPDDPARLSWFSFHNRDDHEQAVRAIFVKTGASLPLYPIDPIKIEDFEDWLYTHQAMHNSVNDALALQGNDLTSVDPRKPEQLANWIQLHAAEHVAWARALGIG